MNSFNLDIFNVNSDKFKMCIAVEIIKKVLFKNNSISSKELNNLIAVANRSVKGK